MKNILNRKIIVYFSLITLVFAAGYLTSSYQSTSSTINNNQQKITQPTNKNDILFNLSYFDDYKGTWSYGSPDGEKAIDSKYNPRSVPGEIKHTPSLKKESTKIIPVSRSQIKNDFGYPNIVDEIYKEYGNRLGGYFASIEQAVISYQTFDVDDDGLKEEIVETANIAGTHPPHYGYIVKNDTIILSISLDAGGIEQTKDGNGFYLQNAIRDDDQPLCCPNGYRLYRIIYDNDSFTPVWEQEVKYIKVND